MVDLDAFENLLLSAALRRRAVTYGEALRFFERRVTPVTVRALCRDLGKVCRRVEEAGGPDLACLLVRQGDGLPGEGYFASVREEGAYAGPSTGPEAEAFIAARQEAAFAHARRLKRAAEEAS